MVLYSILLNDTQMTNVVVYILSFVIVILLAYFVSKFIASKSMNLHTGKSMKIIDVMNLGNNNKITIVKILDNIYILGVNNNGIDILDKIEDEERLQDINIQNEDNIFHNYLNKSIKDYLNKDKEKKKSLIKSNRKINIDKLTNLKSKLENIKRYSKYPSKKDED